MTTTERADKILSDLRKVLRGVQLLSNPFEFEPEITINTDYLIEMCKVMKELNEKVKGKV